MSGYYTDERGLRHPRHDVFGGPHDEPPEEITLNAPLKYTYAELRAYLNEHGHPGDPLHGEGLSAELPEMGVTVHDHPHGGTARELHVMAGGQKVAEIGPADDTDRAEGEHDEVVPGYVDFLAEWDGQPVRAARVKLKIAQDNGLEPDEKSARERAMTGYFEEHDAFSMSPHGVFCAAWEAAVEFMTR